MERKVWKGGDDGIGWVGERGGMGLGGSISASVHDSVQFVAVRRVRRRECGVSGVEVGRRGWGWGVLGRWRLVDVVWGGCGGV